MTCEATCAGCGAPFAPRDEQCSYCTRLRPLGPGDRVFEMRSTGRETYGQAIERVTVRGGARAYIGAGDLTTWAQVVEGGGSSRRSRWGPKP